VRLAGAPLLRGLARVVERALAIAGALFIVCHIFLDVSRVTTSSMAPLLRGSDRGEPDVILAETFFTARTAPRRFQVVTFLDDEGVRVSKRVVGFPGETLRVLADRTLLVDGEKVEVPEGVGGDRHGYLPAGNLHDGRPFSVPQGQLYVLGDDTRDSFDSRFTGGLPIEKVVGRVLFRLWPPRRFRCLL
jgi:signal peptidase I